MPVGSRTHNHGYDPSCHERMTPNGWRGACMCDCGNYGMPGMWHLDYCQVYGYENSEWKMEPAVTVEQPDMVNAPAHYTVGGIETIDFIEAKKLGYHLANAVKYISRAEHKGKFEEDVSKAIWYLQRVLEYRKSI